MSDTELPVRLYCFAHAGREFRPSTVGHAAPVRESNPYPCCCRAVRAGAGNHA